MILRKNNYPCSFVDTETTGLVKPLGTRLNKQPHITEICILCLDKKFKIIDEIDTLIKPPVEIPLFIQKYTGITNELVKKSPSFKEISKDIKQILKHSQMMVAQNLMFDLRMIEIEFQRLNKSITFPPRLFCTVEQSLHFEGYRLKSTELYKYSSQKEIKGIHRARNDVLAMIEYFKMIYKPFIPKHLKQG